MMNTNEPLLILCGGKSQRMGQNKALLRVEGQTLIERHINNAKNQRPVWLAAGETRFEHIQAATYLPDFLPDQQGALSAILPALMRAKERGFSGLFVMSCDTLLLPEKMIEVLKTVENQTVWQQGVVFFEHENHWLPLLSHWSVALSGSLKTAVEHQQKRVQHWIKQQEHHILPLPENWANISNFNTPDEFERALLAQTA